MNSIKLQVTKVIALTLCLWMVGNVAKAQDGSEYYAEFEQPDILEIESGSSLKQALNLIENRFNVGLLYKTSTVQGKQVSKDHKLIGSLREVTDKLLEEHGLRIKHFVSKTYGIYNLKNEVQHFEEALFSVNGIVTDASTGDALQGVNVVVKGTTSGTSTDFEGQYELDAPSANDTLIFSFIGYETLTEPINGRSTVDVQIEQTQQSLGDLVVTGYSTQQSEDVTSSIATADVEAMQNRATTNTVQALQGNAAGVQISARGGNPGDDMNITIRGISSFSGDNSPLVIVDGVEVETGLRNVNSNDIESIQVLKDASSAAIYGSRAANGVILVETKEGRSGTQLSYQNYIGMQRPAEGISLANANQYVTIMQRMYGENLSRDPLVPQAAKDYLNNPNDFQSYDWIDLIYDTAPMHSHDLAVSGGDNEIGSYRVSAGYIDQEGITAGTGFERLNVRGKGELYVNDNITIGQSVSLLKSKTLPEAAAFSRSIYQQAIKMPPYFSPKLPNGEWRTSSFYYGGGDNPEALIRNPFHFMSIWEQPETNSEVSVNMFGEVDFSDELTYKVSASYSQNEYESVYRFGDKGEHQGEYFNANKEISVDRNRSYNWNIDNTLRYSKDFGIHDLDLLGGFVAQKFGDRWMNGSKRNFLSDITTTLDGPGGKNPNVGGGEAAHTVLSFIGQAFYSYDDRYLLTVNFRRDGSSRFAPDQRWGNFPGVSLAWRLSNESFWQNSGLSETINELKIRGGYGELGRQNLGNYDYTPVLEYQPVVLDGTINDGLITGTPINQAISWERLITNTIGVDYELFEGKISGSFEYFNNDTEDMIIDLPLAPSVGGGVLQSNTGKVNNKGFEMSLNYSNQAGDFNYSAGFNLSTTNLTLIEIGTEKITPWFGPEWDVPHVFEIYEGRGLAEFWLIETDGIFKSEQEILNHTSSDGTVIQPNAQPGDIRFVDANDDGTINSDGDRQFQGSGIPDFDVGFNFSANYKNFDLNLIMTGAFGQVVYNTHQYLVEKNYRFGNWSTNLLDAYDPDTNPDSDFPRLNPYDQNDNWNSRPSSDRYIENGDYIKVRNLEIGYNLSTNLASRLQMRSARLFVRTQNLWTITGYKGEDPEVGASTLFGGESWTTPFTQGLDRDTAPQATSFQVGVNLEF